MCSVGELGLKFLRFHGATYAPGGPGQGQGSIETDLSLQIQADSHLDHFQGLQNQTSILDKEAKPKGFEWPAPLVNPLDLERISQSGQTAKIYEGSLG